LTTFWTGVAPRLQSNANDQNDVEDAYGHGGSLLRCPIQATKVVAKPRSGQRDMAGAQPVVGTGRGAVQSVPVLVGA
jgi:hypothetical protein